MAAGRAAGHRASGTRPRLSARAEAWPTLRARYRSYDQPTSRPHIKSGGSDMGPGAKHFHPVSTRRMLVEGPFSAVLLMAADASRGRLSLGEHPVAPRALGSPMHTHSHEDEYSYILDGQIGAQVGAEVILAGPGDVIAKPSGIPHAFWNAGIRLLASWRSSRQADSRSTSRGWANS